MEKYLAGALLVLGAIGAASAGDRIMEPKDVPKIRAAQDAGVETRLALYKGFGHSLSKPKALRHAMQENLDWFDKHLFGTSSAK